MLRLAALGLLGAVVVLAACSGPSALDSPDAGRTMVYEAGVPNFDLEAVATVRDGQPGLDLYLSVPRASLVFTRDSLGFNARLRYEVEVRGERGRERIASRSLVDTVRFAAYDATEAFRPVIREERISLDPGIYVVVATLTDEQTDKVAARRVRVTVPAPTGAPAMSRPRLSIKRPGEPFEPQTALNVPAGFDSLRTTVELYDTPPGASVRLRLDRLESDTTVARPGFWIAYSRAALEFKGVDFEGPPADMIQVTERTLDQAAEAVTVEVNLPPLQPGVYRLRLEAATPGADAPFAEEVRDFAVREPDFPRLTELDDLIAALAYLTSDRELNTLREGSTAAERRRRFDAFWGTLFNDRRVAAGVIRLYYERVEQANRLFTSHKEGWKTDRGMVYVLLGPPEFVETRPDDETWHYAYGTRDALATFIFERASYFDGRLRPAFENWVLVRSAAYEPVWRRAIRNWREGVVR